MSHRQTTALVEKRAICGSVSNLNTMFQSGSRQDECFVRFLTVGAGQSLLGRTRKPPRMRLMLDYGKRSFDMLPINLQLDVNRGCGI